MSLSHDQELKKSLYRNWVKAALALKYLKEGISNVVDSEVKRQQTLFLTDIENTLGLRRVTCGQCTTENVITGPTKGICYKQGRNCSYHTPGKLPRLCPNKVCDKLVNKIATQHRHGSPSWKNTDATKWCTDHWELAKCFISESGYKDKSTAAQTDCSGILSVAINGLFMQTVLAAPINPPGDILSKNRQARNTILHSSDLEVTDGQLGQYIDDMIDLLNDNKTIVNHPDAIKARMKLHQLKSDKMVITNSDEMHVRKEALKAIEEKKSEALHSLETALLDSLDNICTKQQELVNENKIQIRDYLDETRNKLAADLQSNSENTEASMEEKLDTKLQETLEVLERAKSDCQKKQSDLQEQFQQIDANCQRTQELVSSVQQGIHQCQIDIEILKADMQVVKDGHIKTMDHLLQKQKLQQRLRGMYKRHLKTIPISPLLREVKADVNTVFTKLVIRNDLIHDPGQRKSSTTGSTSIKGEDSDTDSDMDTYDYYSDHDIIRSYKDIFYRGKSSCKNIFIIGDAGMGKTTWGLKLVNTWLDCLEKKEQNLDTTTDDEKVLLAYEYVFYISLRNAKSDGQISEMIRKQLFLHEPELNSISKVVIENEPEKCLIFLDGLDEWSNPEDIHTIDDTDLPGRNNIQNCTILTTTRPWKLASLRPSQNEIDRAVEIRGLDTDGIAELSTNVIQNLNCQSGRNELVESFLECINQNHLKRFISVPLLLIALVSLWYTKGDLENTMAGIYSGLIDILIKYAEGNKQASRNKRIESKLSDIPNLDEIKDSWYQQGCNIPDCLSRRTNCKMYAPLLLKLGKLARYGLFSKDKDSSLVFTEDSIKEYLNQDEMNIALQIGILSQTQEIGNILEREFSISFLHKTMQEFLASVYIISGNEKERAESCNTYTHYCKSYKDVFEMENIILFVSGMCPASAGKMSEYVSENVAKLKHYLPDWPYESSKAELKHLSDLSLKYASYNLQNLLLNCVKQERAVSSGVSHIYIKYVLLKEESAYYNDDAESVNSTTIQYIHQQSRHRCISLVADRVDHDTLRSCLKEASQLDQLVIYASVFRDQKREYLSIDLSHISNLKSLDITDITAGAIRLPQQECLREVYLDGCNIDGLTNLNNQKHLKILDLKNITGVIEQIDLTRCVYLTNLKIVSLKTRSITLPVYRDPSQLAATQSPEMIGITTENTSLQLREVKLGDINRLEEVHMRDIKHPEGDKGHLVLNLINHKHLKILDLKNIEGFIELIDLTECINLTQLKLYKITTRSIILPKQGCLQEVDLESIKHPKGDKAHLILDINNQEHLKYLNISNIKGVIEHIDLSGCSSLTYLFIETVTSDSIILPKQGCLQEVDLWFIKHPQGDKGHLVLNLNNQEHLKTLNISNIKGVIEHIDLSGCSRLTYLRIGTVTTYSIILPQQRDPSSRDQLQTLDMKGITTENKTLRLREVKLGVINPVDVAEQLLRDLQNQSGLKILTFDDITSEHVVLMVESLHILPQVKRLEMRRIDFGTAAFFSENMEQLEHVDMYKCKMTPVNWRTFVDSVIQLKHEVIIHLNCYNHDSDIYDYIEQSPHVTIKHTYDTNSCIEFTTKEKNT